MSVFLLTRAPVGAAVVSGAPAGAEAAGYAAHGGIPVQFVATIRDYLHRVEASGFSGAVALGQGDELLLSEGYGSLSCGGARQIVSDTPFYVASLSKPFTAAAILKLEADGKLRTSDLIAKHLPNVPEDKREITVHHLLTHTSGLGRPSREAAAAALDADAFATAAFEAPLQAQPGTAASYSNVGYSLLAAIVQRSSGHGFADYLRSEIFEPAGMTRTGLITQTDRWSAEELARACNGTLDQGDAVLSHHRPVSWSEYGAVGVVTTAPDLLRWAQALQSGEILAPPAVARMFAVHAESFGYGWVHSPRATGRTLIWHDGQLLPEGWNAQIRIYPERRLTWVVLSNRYEQEPLGWKVAQAIDRLLAGGELVFPPPFEPMETVAALESGPDLDGIHRLEHGGSFQLSGERARLILAVGSQEAVNLLLGVASDRVTVLATANGRTQAFLDSLLAGGSTRIPQEVTGRATADWLPRFESTWEWLAERFGPYRGYEVLHSVPAPFGDAAALTFARLDFRDRSTTVRLIWVDGAFQAMSDEGAFVGTTPAVAVVPAPLPLVRTAEDRYTGFRLATGDVIEVQVVDDAAGCSGLCVYGPGGSAAAKKVGSCEEGGSQEP